MKLRLPLTIGLVVISLAAPSVLRAEPGAQIPTTKYVYPKCAGVLNVQDAPYSAKGDGHTDDTDALQRALNDVVGSHRVLYFPSGTYLVSRMLTWPNQVNGKDNWGFTYLRGQSALTTTIRLKDGIFADPAQPQSLMWCGGFGSADWFHNYIEDLTFDVGAQNPGAIALQFYSNNSGAVRRCRFLAAEGSGHTGLDLNHRNMNGPLLVKNCLVKGFKTGILTGNAVNSQTFEHVTLEGQREVGYENMGQPVSMRGLLSINTVPAIKTYGTLCVIDSQFVGQPGAEGAPAVLNYNGGRIYVRDVATTGYKRAIGDVDTPDSFAAYRLEGPDKLGSLGPNVEEYCSHPLTNPHRAVVGSLRLPIEETPLLPEDPLSHWANVVDFGADPTGQADSSVAIQKAIDSGATTVFLPGHFALQKTVIVRGAVRRIIGTGGWIDYTGQAKPDFRVEDGKSPVISFEHISSMHGGIEFNTRRTIVMLSACDGQSKYTAKTRGGKLFFEDVCTSQIELNQQKMWARQLNVENEGTHILNTKSDLWILGYKTERGGTLVETRPGGRSEVLGGFSYTTTAGKLAPMFVTDQANVFTFFTEICFNGDPFETLIRETQQKSTKLILREQGSLAPYRGGSPQK